MLQESHNGLFAMFPCQDNMTDELSKDPPPMAVSSQTPPFWHRSGEHPPNRSQHWYAPKTLLSPGPAHWRVSPALIGCPLNSRPSMQPMKACGIPCALGWASVAAEARSSAPWVRSMWQGWVAAEAVCLWSRDSRRRVELTSSSRWCQRPSVTGSARRTRDPGGPLPQRYRNSSSPLVSCGKSWRCQRDWSRDRYLLEGCITQNCF